LLDQDESAVPSSYAKTSQSAGQKAVRDFTDDILEKLGFLCMEDRYQRIAETYEKTFEWIYHDPKAGCKPWSNFAKWLKTESGPYWITGKPGAGKSTLIKFIYGNQHTENLLGKWLAGLSWLWQAFTFGIQDHKYRCPRRVFPFSPSSSSSTM
jgi:hypothetical protein